MRPATIPVVIASFPCVLSPAAMRAQEVPAYGFTLPELPAETCPVCQGPSSGYSCVDTQA